MHSAASVAAVLSLKQAGHNDCEIAHRTGVPRRTVSDWTNGKLPRSFATDGGVDGRLTGRLACSRCGAGAHEFEQLPLAYVYLLGIYLGDGCIARHPRGVYRIRINLDLRHPRIIEECKAAIASVLPANKVHVLHRRSNYVDRPTYSHVEVSAYSKSWVCLLPQHGAGRKHQRKIALTTWQRDLVAANPEALLRGLVHSDGCRFINTGRGWRHPRYSFDNLSGDIRRIFCDTCEILGLHWTSSGSTIYVSRKADVARLDQFIGPKR